MALQFLLVRFGSSHIRFGSFYLGRCFWCNGVNIVVLTVGSFSIVVACNTSNMNQQRKRMVLVVINGNVVLGHAPTCSTLRCVKFTNDHASVLIPPRLTSGLLCLRLFCRQFSDRCSNLLISNWISMCCEAPFRLAASLYGHYVLCKPRSTSMEAQSVVLTRTCSNTPNSEFINMNRVYNGCQTHIIHHLQGNPCFPWSSLVFMGFPNDGIAVPLGPLWFLMVPPILKTFLVQRS